MLTIKVLGAGCANCRKVEELSQRVVGMLGAEAEILKVTDYAQITKYPILATPGLVINEQVVCSGRIPTEAEVTTWVATALEQG